MVLTEKIHFPNCSYHICNVLQDCDHGNVYIFQAANETNHNN